MRRLATALLVLVLAGCAASSAGGGVGNDKKTPGVVVGTVFALPTPPEWTPSAAGGGKLTAAQITQVQTILNASVKHYQDAYAAGKKALGTTQYADAFAGLAAMNDPTSNAAKFRDWRSSSQIEQDVTYLDAFQQADAYYTADNEPAAIGDWELDMGDFGAAIDTWIQTAVSWQISEVTDAALARDAKKVTDAFAKVQADVTAVVAQSN